MNGKTHAYLDLAERPAVGDVLLDPRPAFVFSGEGSSILWANAAGAALFGEETIADLLERRLTRLNPVKAQIGRLARLLPVDKSRLEILRIGLGVRLVTLLAACRRLDLADGSRAVLAVGVGSGQSEALGTRAERLAEAIAGRGEAAAVIDADGRVLGASRGYAAAEGGRVSAVDFEWEGRRLTLVVVAASVLEEPPAAHPETAPVGEPVISPEPSPAATRAVVRFVWRTDKDHRFTLVSPELAAAVGEGHAAIVGLTWEAVAPVLGLDPDGSIGAAFDKGARWAATVYWPVEGQKARIAVDLAAEPATARSGARDGFRGFGVCRADDRRADERPEPLNLPGTAAAGERAAETPVTAAEVETPPPTEEQAPIERSEPPADEDDLDSVARMSVEEGWQVEARPRPPSEPARPAKIGTPSNIVRLPGAAPARTHAEPLSGTERDAFRRIAEALAREGDRAGAAGDTPTRGVSGLTGRVARPAIDASLLNRVPVGLMILRGRKPLFGNRTLLDLLGYDSLDQLVAADGIETIFPDHTGGWTGASFGDAGAVLTARRRDGGLVPVDVRLHTVAWEGATALMFSISQRRDANVESRGASDKLAEADTRIDELEQILDTATDGVIVIDGAGKIGSMNRAAQALFGVDAADFRGRHFTDLLAAESHKPALDYLDGLAANGVASVLNDGREVIGSVPQGGLIPLFMTMGRVGRSDTFCAVLRDITHWKRVEEELTTARRAAETANAQKSEFLAKVSHEIRTPLNAIIGFSEVMMEERFGPIGNERYRDYLNDIHVSGAHLMSLINDLLDLSKIEAGKLELSFEAVPVNTLIQEAVALMQPAANRERIIIRTSLSTEVPNVVADARAFRQILLNLLSNAIKFTKAGGQVIVSSALEETGEVAVRVRDTGVGMSEKDIETALKPFHQVAAGRQGRDKGTGLGLPLTKAMVEANRANFTIDSAIDQGTLVKITFPTTRVLAG